MANNSNKKLVPEAMDALDKFKYEVASDLAVKKIFKPDFKMSKAHVAQRLYGFCFFNSR